MRGPTRLCPRLGATPQEEAAQLRPNSGPAVTVAALWHARTRRDGVLAWFPRLYDEGRVAARGETPLLALRRAGRPVIVAGLHLGNWEILGLTLLRLGMPPVVMHEPPPPGDFRGRVLVRAREEAGARLLPLGRDATWPAVRALRGDRDILYMLVDEVTDGRPMAPRLGRREAPAGNLAQAVKLARATGAAIVPGYALRRPGPRFEARFLPPLEVPRTGDRAADIAAGIAALDAAIETEVLRHIEQWFPLLYFRPEP